MNISKDHGRLDDSHIHKGMRKKLIEELRAKKIFQEKILAAMAKVPRHLFVPKGFEQWAYQDVAFPIGSDQTISQPYTVAFQTQLLDVRPGDKILEIGTGSGFQAAILSELGAKVYTLERQEILYHQTAALLKKMGYVSIRCYLRDGFEGLPKYAPYHKIIITCGAPNIPQPLIDQLMMDGSMIIPLNEGEEQSMKRIYKRSVDSIQEESHGMFRFVPFLGGINRK
jgi:protein-L-isoaspartate(D-aspartate) O-methyltransferase